MMESNYEQLVKALRSASTVQTAWEKLMNDAAAAIEALQAQLPKRGEWKTFDLTYGRSIYSCSVCEQATEVPMCMEKPMYAYCPNCGAKMEVQDADK